MLINKNILKHFAIGFCAFNNVQQVIPNETYTKVNFNTAIYDTSGGYDTQQSTWTPITNPEKVEDIVRFDGQVWIVGGAALPPNKSNPTFVVKVFRNGNSVFTGIGTPDYAMPGTVTIQFSGQDLAHFGDQYTVNLYATASTDPNLTFKSTTLNTVLVDNNQYHTFWCGNID